MSEQRTSVGVWKINWQSSDYRKKLITGLILISFILFSLPFFFQAIEQRNGISFNDYLLSWLPAYDLSIYIFTVIWSMTLLTFSRFKQDPNIFLTFLWGFILINLSRFVSIGLIPLNAPADLIPIHDPISNHFYGPKFITKDLFFSGHTASTFLLLLCLEKKNLVFYIFLLYHINTVFFLIITHEHYTIDILGAYFITYSIYTFMEQKKLV